jgi:hypothetical protein
VSDPLVVIDGAGDRYRVVGFHATFTLKNEDTGRYVFDVSSATLRELGIEWDGRTLRRLASDEGQR